MMYKITVLNLHAVKAGVLKRKYKLPLYVPDMDTGVLAVLFFCGHVCQYSHS
jgi:hypothetical protein